MRGALKQGASGARAESARPQPLHRLWPALTGFEGDDSLHEYMTRAAFLLILGALALSTVAIVAGWLIGLFTFWDVTMVVVIDLMLGAAGWLVWRGFWRPARWVPIVIFLIIGILGSTSTGMESPYTIFYALTILLTGALYGSRAQWLSLGLCLAMYVGIGWAATPRLAEERWSLIVAIGGGLVGITLMQSLLTRQLQRTLAQSHRVAEELRAEVGEHQRAEDEIRRQTGTLAAMHETALDLAARRALPDMLEAIMVRAVSLLGAHGGLIQLYRPETDDLENALSYNMGQDFAGVVLRRGEGLSGRVLDSGQAMAVSNYRTWDGRAPAYDGYDWDAAAAVPICWAGELLGVLGVVDKGARTFSETDMARLEQFAPLAAAALAHTRLVDDLHERMAQLQAAEAQLVHSARMAAVGQLAAGVAHEINNPLTPVLGLTELLLRDRALDERVRHELEIVVAEARRARDIVRSLLDFSRQGVLSLRPTDVNQLLRDTLLLLRTQLTDGQITVTECYALELPLLPIDVSRLKQVCLNLMTNAVHAMPEGGQLTITTERAGDRVALRVSDTGCGIPAEIMPRVFDPFFSTKLVGKGVGLGLAMSLGIVQDHGGSIELESEGVPGKGTTATVWLPVGSAE